MFRRHYKPQLLSAEIERSSSGYAVSGTYRRCYPVWKRELGWPENTSDNRRPAGQAGTALLLQWAPFSGHWNTKSFPYNLIVFTFKLLCCLCFLNSLSIFFTCFLYHIIIYGLMLIPFWAVTSCGNEKSKTHSNPEDGGSMYFWNVGSIAHEHTA
jgi:hypothetical protein